MRKVKYKISDEEIINIYLSTKSLRKTAKAALGNSGTHTIAKKLRSLGIEVKNYLLKPIKVTDKELITMYNSGMSLQEIAKAVSGSKGAMVVRQRLQNLGIDTSYSSNIDKYREKMSRNFHTYTLDENLFDTINTEEKAYWLGFLMADGYNHDDKNTICLRLQAEDLEILEKFRKFLKSNAPIYEFTRKTRVNKLLRKYVEVRVNSVHLSIQLAKLGCIQGKSYLLEFPTCIPNHLMNHFIRGYFDGDGCICITHRKNRGINSLSYQLTIAGKEDVILKMQDYIIKETGISKTKLEYPKNNFAKIVHYAGRKVVTKILNYLYKNATIYLKRKHDKYLELVTRQSNLQ